MLHAGREGPHVPSRGGAGVRSQALDPWPSTGFRQKSSTEAWVACKRVANIQDITRRHRKTPDGTKGRADLHGIAPGSTRWHPATRSSPNFKTGVPARAGRRVRFPSASAGFDLGLWRSASQLSDQPAHRSQYRCSSHRANRRLHRLPAGLSFDGTHNRQTVFDQPLLVYQR